ncbi:protein BIG GRAIN 1-like A [Andrographis paniculata]|uniref:protein BIG GRAIN 1-like A n=1 Tax=Andrographis paniculata TaxID=175694 RepID=UPI0021E6E239|nr:protein BIG GRAIN 1-like A [Andrographis paniculata]
MVDRIRRYSYPRDNTGSGETEISYYCSNQQSFSSTLLDAIYREIDRGNDIPEEDVAAVYRKKNTVADEKIVAPAADVKKLRNGGAKSRSCSVDSSGGGFFSASGEGEAFPSRRTKTVRTGGTEFEVHVDREINRRSEEKAKHEGGFLKTKSRALKLYGELKKVKQPISPGGKLAGLWNSLLSKKPKLAAGDDSPSLKSATTNTSSSTCSSASSFSRSCLSKTPSSRGKSSGGEKRSVRFFPVSVIVNEDCQPCGHKPLHQESNIKSAIDEELMLHIMSYQKKIENNRRIESPFHGTTKPQGFVHPDVDDYDDEFDGSSESSSDLFELDNLSSIGMNQRYVEQLPVYETTDLRTNRAIADTFIF